MPLTPIAQTPSVQGENSRRGDTHTCMRTRDEQDLMYERSKHSSNMSRSADSYVMSFPPSHFSRTSHNFWIFWGFSKSFGKGGKSSTPESVSSGKWHLQRKLTFGGGVSSLVEGPSSIYPGGISTIFLLLGELVMREGNTERGGTFDDYGKSWRDRAPLAYDFATDQQPMPTTHRGSVA